VLVEVLVMARSSCLLLRPVDYGSAEQRSLSPVLLVGERGEVVINWLDGRSARPQGDPEHGATQKPVDALVRIAGHLDRVALTHHEST